MPFTVSHTVAVIPLYKYLGRFGALSALIIGSMTPDFAYLTPYLVHQRMESHSLIGVYLYCIPMGLTVYFLYHLLMAPVIVSILPKPIQHHLHPDLFAGKLPNIPSYALLFSIILGALTHVFWDFFTHQSGIPQYVSWMDVPLTNIDGYDIMPYRVLQHMSSILGLSLLLFWIWAWIARKKQEKSPANSETNRSEMNNKLEKWQAPDYLKRFAVFLLLTVPAIAGIFMGWINMPDTDVMHGIYRLQVFVKNAIVGAAGGFMLATILLGLLYQYKIHQKSN